MSEQIPELRMDLFQWVAEGQPTDVVEDAKKILAGHVATQTREAKFGPNRYDFLSLLARTVGLDSPLPERQHTARVEILVAMYYDQLDESNTGKSV